MNDRFAYRKRWGAEVADDDAKDFRFRLWAPAVPNLHLVYGPRRFELQMTRTEDGWFEATTNRVGTGDPYAFRLPDGTTVPDPAARAQVGDVHGDSLLVDPRAYRWRSAGWTGRPWEEAVIYELHTGTFTEDGTFAGIVRRLDHLAETGITAVELMPVAQFGGRRGWGYDGVLMYAPHNAYGGPGALKSLVDAAHERELMVLLDVVYNHFGPDGSYLHHYAPEFFDTRRQTPWGAAIAYPKPAVREFFVDNVLYWLEEYRFDGLRFDAINEIKDESEPEILEEIARTVRARITDRHVHLTTEDDRNITRLHERDPDGAPRLYTAEWNDDFHHAAHVAATGETEGYYADYAEHRIEKLARTLAQGFTYQGEASHFWDGAPRGVPSAHLPLTSFVNFIQNHDQTGNRAFGERLTDLASAEAVEALTAILILSPQIPLLFMGDEWGETNSFCYFTDFHGELADAVREGRRREFQGFSRFADVSYREKIPDPNAESTFRASRLDWDRLTRPDNAERHALVRRLLDIRKRHIAPRLRRMQGHAGTFETADDRALAADWVLGDGSRLGLVANLSDAPCSARLWRPGHVLYESSDGLANIVQSGTLSEWCVVATLDGTAGGSGAA